MEQRVLVFQSLARESNQMQKLPIGEQFFARLRERNLPDTIYLLEFKMSTGAIALQQIREKQYAQPFLGSNKTVILLGIAFDQESRNIVDWQHETT